MSRLHSVRITSPGRFGLTDSTLGVEDPRWLEDVNNLVFGTLGDLEGRSVFDELTTSGSHNDATVSIHEYIKDATTTEIISSAGLKIYEGTTSLSDVTGTITTPTANNWQFVNFNGKCIGVQQSHTPIVYSGTSFADISAASGSLPTGNCALSAFGRLWVADANKTTVKWCAVLDETDWGGAGAGSLDTLQVWPDGIDTVTALGELQGRLVIFGTRSILVYSNPEDPTVAAFALQDVIRIGTRERDSVVGFSNDLYFLNENGLQTVARATQYENAPQASISPHTSNIIKGHLDNTTTDTVKGAYSESLQAIIFLVRNSTVRDLVLFDTRERLQDGTMRMLEWDGLPTINPNCVVGASDGVTYFGTTGNIAWYNVGTYTDAVDATRTLVLKTVPWNCGHPGMKILKEVGFEGVSNGSDTGAIVQAEADGKGLEGGTTFTIANGATVETSICDGLTGNNIAFRFQVQSDAQVRVGALVPRFKTGRMTSYGD